jgi:transposase
LDYASGQLVWQTSTTKDSATSIEFLGRVAAAFPTGRIVVVLDNVGYHKSAATKPWWVQQQARIRPTWLPTYSPELNPIERVWRHLTDKLGCHRW